MVKKLSYLITFITILIIITTLICLNVNIETKYITNGINKLFNNFSEILDLNGNVVSNNEYLEYIKNVNNTIDSPSYQWTSNGHLVTNIPISNWTRSSNSVLFNRIESGIVSSWNWDTIRNLNEDYSDISQVWDLSRNENHFYDGFIPNGTLSIYDGVLYDAATWKTDIKKFNYDEATEELYQFKGTFHVDPTLDMSELYFTLTSVASDERIYLNDNIYVFVYPKCIENEINSNASSDRYFMRFFAYWCGTISSATGNECDFNGVEGNEAINEGTEGINVTGWSMNTVTDNAGAAIQYGYNLVRNFKEYDGTYVIRIIGADIATGGGMYRQKLGCEFKTSKIAYVGNGAMGNIESQEKEYGKPLTIKKCDGFIKEGYHFKEWNTAADGSGKTYAIGAKYTDECGVILYAQWEPNTYTVKYNGNGATGGSTANSSHTYDVAKELTANGYERKYTVTYNHNYSGSANTSKTATYTFKNWNTVAGGTGTSYDNNAAVKNLTTTANGTVNLYAQWTSSSVTYVPTRTGYIFGGWYKESACTTKVTDRTYTPTANITLYAKWTPITYTVKYNGNGATGGSTASSTHTYDVAKNLTTNGYERKYTVTYNHNYSGSTNTSKTATYSFAGWSKTADGVKVYDNGASVKNLTATNNGTVNLYAMWTSASVTYVPTRTGYIFGGWYKDAACTNSASSTNGVYTPTTNITLYAKWTPITYTVKYNGNGATGGSTANSSHTYDKAKNLTLNGYERKYTVTYNHNYTGSTTTSKTATYTFKNWNTVAGGTGNSYNNNASVKNLTTTANGTVNLYAQWTSNSVTYVPTRTGYIFGGWYKESACTTKVTDGTYTPTSNITVYAKWTANTDTAYTVKHWKQNLGVANTQNSTNYTLADTENLKGTTDTSVTPAVKSYTGFTSPSAQTITIKGDGTAVVNYYYTRNSYKVSLNKGIGISEVTGAGTYQYEAGVTIDATVLAGYTWKDWTGSKQATTKQYTFTMPASNVTNTANATANTYTVKYNGNGATGGSTASSTHTYGVTKNLTTNGYERKYTVTYNHNYSGSTNTSKTATYSFAGWSKTADGIKAYEDNQSVRNLTTTANGTVNLYAMWNSSSVTYVPTRVGYTFAGWYKEASCTNNVSGTNGAYTPTSNITLYAKWTTNTDTAYTVKHWKQNLGVANTQNSTNYTLADTENLKGTTDTSVTPAVKSYTGFTSPSAQTITIKGDGTAVVNYYYTRNSYKVSLNKGIGISEVTGAGTYQYEAGVTIDATVLAGYTWKDWTGSKQATTKQYTFTMPASNVTNTANATANTYTIKYNGNGATEGETASSTHIYDVPQNLTINGFKRKYTVTYNHNYTGSTDTQKIATYTFKNWNTQADGNGVSYEDEVSVINLTSTLGATINMYAQWTSASVSYTPTRPGYRFLGWYSESSCTTKITDGTYTPTANITLYAKWEIDNEQTKNLSYTVEYYKDNIKVDADTQTLETTVQLLQPNTLTVDKTAINTTDKYEGYRLEKTEPITIPDTIETGSIIKVYYVKRSDLSYSIKYLEKDTNIELASKKTVENQTFENTVAESAIDIEGYDKVNPTEKSIQIAVSGNEIVFYYTKRTDLSYTVKYLEQDTNIELANEKIVTNRTYQETITEEAIDIEGYDKVEPIEKSIQIAVSGNEIVFYYTKRTDLSYTVKYLEKDTDTELATAKTVGNQIFESTVTESAIDIDGYDKVAPTEKSIQIAVTGNEIVFYYTKRTDLSYTVKYLEKDTNVELATAKTVGNQIFESTATENAIEIEGYDKVNPTEKSIQIAVSGNEIIFYYTKRTDLSYTVKYLEKDTNKELATVKTVGNQTFESTATEQAIDIKGYDKVEPIEKTIQIAVSGNEIIFYYTKRKDLSYTVKYLEQDTNKELATAKTVGNQTFESTATEQAIDINGYDKVEPTEKSIQIAVSGNEIIFYYTKRTDLSYTVKYLEKDTNVELETAKTVGNQIFESTATEQAIKINGYDKVEPTEKSIQIAVTGNEIVFYYTKRVDLSYTVNYLLKDNDEDNSNNTVLHEQKIVKNQRFKDEITTRNEVIDIYGYKLDSIDKEILTIETTENVINIYYVIDEAQTKELSYTVEYYINGEKQEDDTIVITETVQVLKPDTLPMKQELIDGNKYTGYEIDTTKEIPEIVNNGGIVEIHYKNRTFGYKVKYYFNGYVDEALTEEKRAEYLDVIDTYEDKIKEGYKFDQIENCPLTITEKEDSNVIKVYYKTDQTVIKEVTYEILYYKDGVVVDRRTVTRRVQVLLPDKVAVDKTLVETDRYEDSNFVKTEPEEIPDLIESGETISVYYETKTSQVVAKYVDKVTGEVISEETIEGKVGDTYTIEQKEIEGYTLIESPERTGTIAEEAQEKVFYYAKNAEVKAKYLEKGTEEVLANEETIEGYEGKEYETELKEIENYELVETIGIPSGTMQAGTQEVIYYYAQKTKVTVNHIDVISGEIFETETISGKVGDEYITSSKDFEGYVLEEKPEQEKGTMTKDEIVLNYYYKHISAGVVVKYIDKTSEEILENEIYEGNEGDEYTTTPKEFEGYGLDETILPENSQGTMTKELIEVKYYYVRKAQVKVQYLDRNTNEAISEEIVITGHEGDSYTSEAKTIEDYYLVESMLPENSTGTMTKEEITVTYYYAKKSAGVIEKHINEKTEEILEEKLYEGLIGDDYKTSSKDFEGYDLDITKLPENAEGKMTEELIEVKYYYIRKAQVRVEHIDEFTNEVINQEIIAGHEGDSYTTNSKEIKGYILDEEKIPDNKDGIMIITVNEDGTVTSEIVVKYYYKKISAGVLEKHIDIKTNDVLVEKFYSGNVGDTYKIEAKEYEKYDLVEKDAEGNSKLPENAEGTMTEDLIEVNYYYIRKSTVRVEYVDNETGKKVAEDTIIEGHEDDEYKTTAKEIKDYTLNKDKLPANSEGTMKVVRSEYFVDEVKTETVVTYYYDKVKKTDENKNNNNNDNSNNTKPDNKPNDSNNNNNGNSNNTQSNNNNNNSDGKTQTIIISTDSSNASKANTSNTSSTTQNNKTTMPSTGDMMPIIATALILLVSLVNIVQIIISKRKKDSK